MKVAAVIPCRYQSSRFEGKPLALIGEMPMMWHVYQQAGKAALVHEVHIATDDPRIESKCIELGINVLMTSTNHVTGTDRVAECASMTDADIIVNVQGDEPFISPLSIDAVIRELQNSKLDRLAATNGCRLIENQEELTDEGVVKVIRSSSGLALAYSRLPIPLSFRLPARHYRQLGLYAFHRDSLEFFASTAQGPVEASESVEMYRFVEHNRPVLMVEVENLGVAVDTPFDLYEARLHYDNIIEQSIS